MPMKITIFGAGNVGATTASLLIEKRISEIVLIDIVENYAKGKALDIFESTPMKGFATKISGTHNQFELIKDSNIVIITAGSPRKPGMSREDLLEINAGVVKEICLKVIEYAPTCILMIVTNPVDTMCYLAQKITNFPRNRIIGIGGGLDASRFVSFISLETGISPENIHGTLIGGHGDKILPLLRYTTIAGMPITEILSEEQIEKIIKHTQNAGAEIVGLLRTGSAFFAPASSIVDVIESIVYNKHKIIPCSVYIDGEYGIFDVFLVLQTQIGESGIEKIFTVSISQDEIQKLTEIANQIKSSFNRLQQFYPLLKNKF